MVMLDDGLGILLSRTEAAGVVGGEPLSSYEVPEAERDAHQTIAHWESWVKDHVVTTTGFWFTDEFISWPPFDGVPDRLTALWFDTWYHPEAPARNGRQFLEMAELLRPEAWVTDRTMATATSPERVPAPTRLKWAREVLLGRQERLPTFTRPLDYDLLWNRSFALPAECRVGIQIALAGREAVTDNLVRAAQNPSQKEFLASHVVAWRALVLPLLTAEQRNAMLVVARDPGVAMAHRLLVSAVAADTDEHTELVMAADPAAYQPYDTHRAERKAMLAAVGANIADAGARAELARRRGTDVLGSIGPVELALFPDRSVLLVDQLNDEGPTSLLNSRAECIFSRISGVGGVSLALQVWADSRVQAAPRQWLIDHPAQVAQFSESLASNKKYAAGLAGVARELAATVPNFAPQHPVARDAVEKYRLEQAAPLLGGNEGYPQWWVEALAAETETPAGNVKIPKKPPVWMAGITGMGVGESRLSVEDTMAVLQSAILSSANEDLSPRPLVAAVRQRMTTAQRDSIGELILSNWLDSGGDNTQGAYFLGSGFLGAAGLVATLAPLVGDWPQQSQHKRAVTGLDVMAATGTVEALQAISFLAVKAKSKGIKEAAKQSVTRLAAIRGLSADELEDRIIPDGDLDADGTITLSVGARQFRVGVDSLGKVGVRELDDAGQPVGKARPSLPDPRAGDDPDQATEAKTAFAKVKRSINDVVKVQSVRLAQAMVSGRSWSLADHRALYLNHPLMNGLIGALVWSVTPTPGESSVLIRATEDREYVTIAEESYVLADESQARLSLAHPIDLTEEQKNQWRSHLDDYELVPPFPQLDRDTFGLPPGQPNSPQLLELPVGELHPGTLVSLLEKEGWVRQAPEDGGVSMAFELPVPTREISVVIGVTGIFVGAIAESGPQQIESVVVLSRHTGRELSWHDVPATVVSETRRVLSLLAKKIS